MPYPGRGGALDNRSGVGPQGGWGFAPGSGFALSPCGPGFALPAGLRLPGEGVGAAGRCGGEPDEDARNGQDLQLGQVT